MSGYPLDVAAPQTSRAIRIKKIMSWGRQISWHSLIRLKK
jgi:hypothetical protein